MFLPTFVTLLTIVSNTRSTLTIAFDTLFTLNFFTKFTHQATSTRSHSHSRHPHTSHTSRNMPRAPNPQRANKTCDHPGCSRAFCNTSELQRHQWKEHRLGEEPETFPCSEPGCSKVLDSLSNLRRHVKAKHATQNTEPCPYCKKPLDKARQDNAKRHLSSCADKHGNAVAPAVTTAAAAAAASTTTATTTQQPVLMSAQDLGLLSQQPLDDALPSLPQEQSWDWQLDFDLPQDPAPVPEQSLDPRLLIGNPGPTSLDPMVEDIFNQDAQFWNQVNPLGMGAQPGYVRVPSPPPPPPQQELESEPTPSDSFDPFDPEFNFAKWCNDDFGDSTPQF